MPSITVSSGLRGGDAIAQSLHVDFETAQGSRQYLLAAFRILGPTWPKLQPSMFSWRGQMGPSYPANPALSAGLDPKPGAGAQD